MPDRPLGTKQRKVLRSLTEHRHWYPGCGWVWDTVSGTTRVLDTLVRRGLVTKTGKTYRPATPGGA